MGWSVLPLDAEEGEVEHGADHRNMLDVQDKLAAELAQCPGVREQLAELEAKKIRLMTFCFWLVHCLFYVGIYYACSFLFLYELARMLSCSLSALLLSCIFVYFFALFSFNFFFGCCKCVIAFISIARIYA